MEIEYKLEKGGNPLIGVHSDSINLPYTIKYKNKKGFWVVLKEHCLGTVIDPKLFSGVSATKWRLHWLSTDMHQSEGLSTYRSGGGFHADFLC